MQIIGLLGLLFNELFFRPIINLIAMLLLALQTVGIPGALGLTIILLTIFIRLLTWPLMTAQIRLQKKQAELRPHLEELKRKHSQDKKALASAQMELYKEHGVSPTGGCLPALMQIPILIALYQTIFVFFDGGTTLDKVNGFLYSPALYLKAIPDTHFLFFNLADKPADFTKVGMSLLFVPIVTALLQFIQSKMMVISPVKTYPSDSPKEKKEKEGSEDMAQAMQGQMLYMMPLMIGYFAFQFPVGLSLYWNTFTVLGIIQQYLVSGWGGLEGWVKFLKRR